MTSVNERRLSVLRCFGRASVWNHEARLWWAAGARNWRDCLEHARAMIEAARAGKVVRP